MIILAQYGDGYRGTKFAQLIHLRIMCYAKILAGCNSKWMEALNTLGPAEVEIFCVPAGYMAGCLVG